MARIAAVTLRTRCKCPVGSAVEGEASAGVERTIDEQNLSWWPKARKRLQKAAAADSMRRNVTTFVKQLSGTYSILVSRAPRMRAQKR